MDLLCLILHVKPLIGAWERLLDAKTDIGSNVVSSIRELCAFGLAQSVSIFYFWISYSILVPDSLFGTRYEYR